MCSCVDFVQELGLKVGGNAWHIRANIINPAEGIGVLLPNHIAYILAVEDDSIIIMESNFSRCKITFRRIYKNDPQIRGYVK